VVVFFDRNM